MAHIVAYPAILDDRENDPGEYTVTFPDVPGAITDGNNIAEALNNAAIALGLILFDAKELPIPSDLKSVQVNHPETIVSYITVDLDAAKRDSHPPMVKKNTRIPADIATQAEERGINFSATLTMALKEALAKNK